MVSATLFQHAARLLDAVRNGPPPADRQMESYFRAHPKLGVRNRWFVAETVYGCLRRLRFLEYLVNVESAPAEALIAAYLLVVQGWDADALERAGYRPAQGRAELEARTLEARLRSLDGDALPLDVQTDLPPWLLERLVAQLGEAETRALAAALNQSAPLDLRVNPLKADRETVMRRLAEEGFPVTPTPYSPLGLRRSERVPLFKTKAFQDGLLEVQDEGSQLLALLLEPKRREIIVDFCAGGGGKTLHLGALMANTGTIHAFDISAGRLENLKPRLQRAGLDNVRTLVIEHERDPRVLRLRGKADRVLVDAPCSGTGTLRRNPDLKWRAPDLERITTAQHTILAAAAELVRPGGRLVYATCSLLREENEDIVDGFVAAHSEYRIVPVREVLARRRVPLADVDEFLRLYPHRHGTDGFFAAVLERAG
ncbi:MAG: RsmB/NOP family class I SAM-dependent RNA methyltransferase [Gammaproteobacteria bacterium]